MKNKKITIVIPALDEEKNLPHLIPRFQNAAKSLLESGFQPELVLIDDGSTDQTSRIAKDHGFSVVSHPYNLGVCAALQTGFLFAVQSDSDFLITIDSDGQHNPEDISLLLKNHLEHDADITIGSRFINETGYEKQLSRYIGILLFSFIIKMFTGKKIHDITSGFRVFSKKAIKFLANHFPQDYPDAEILILLARFGYRIQEFPVGMNARVHGKSMHNFFTSIIYPFKNVIAIFAVLLRIHFIKKREEQ